MNAINTWYILVLVGGLKSAIFDLLGDLSKSDDLDSISISISILEKNNQF